MNKKCLAALAALIVLAVAYIVFAASTQNKDCRSIADQSSRDDCYHTLAHSTENRTLCNSIVGTEKKEHCLERLPAANN